MAPSTLTSLLPLVIAAFVVVRFALRELRERTVSSPGIWVRPGILTVLSVLTVAMTLGVDGREDSVTTVMLAAGAVIGAATGFGVLRNTAFAPADRPRAVKVQGNPVTLAIWLGALVVRLAARYLYPGGADPRAQLPLNCGTVVLVTVAFVVIAAAFQREIARTAAPAP